nr:MAG TPA: hypothetical protein [Caudoviricetes sp.]
MPHQNIGVDLIPDLLIISCSTILSLPATQPLQIFLYFWDISLINDVVSSVNLSISYLV